MCVTGKTAVLQSVGLHHKQPLKPLDHSTLNTANMSILAHWQTFQSKRPIKCIMDQPLPWITLNLLKHIYNPERVPERVDIWHRWGEIVYLEVWKSNFSQRCEAKLYNASYYNKTCGIGKLLKQSQLKELLIRHQSYSQLMHHIIKFHLARF